MSTVSSTGSGLSNLLQTLTTELPQLSTALSSSKLQTALENASPHDIVELSDAALQLQNVGSLFGTADTTQTTANPFDPYNLTNTFF